jgi:hypothetical protein
VLFLLLMIIAYDAREIHLAREGDADMSLPARTLRVSTVFLGDMITFRLWDTWQSQITFEIVKLVFALTTFPFFVFMIDSCPTLASNRKASGLAFPFPNTLPSLVL